MKYFIPLFCILIFTSCHKETSYTTMTFLLNNTEVDIKLVPYSKGIDVSTKIISLKSKEKFLVYSKSGRGKGGGEIYIEEIYFNDSLIVIFDKNNAISHYNNIISANNPNLKGLYPANNRSLYKRENYTRKILSEDKHSIENEYTYTFTEQDYLDAKNSK